MWISYQCYNSTRATPPYLEQAFSLFNSFFSVCCIHLKKIIFFCQSKVQTQCRSDKNPLWWPYNYYNNCVCVSSLCAYPKRKIHIDAVRGCSSSRWKRHIEMCAVATGICVFVCEEQQQQNIWNYAEPRQSKI